MGFTLPDTFVRAALPLIADAHPASDTLSAAMGAVRDAGDDPPAPDTARALRRAYRAFLGVQYAFEDALRDAGFSYRPGDRAAEAMWRQLTLNHGAGDLGALRWEVPGSPTWAGSGYGENKPLAYLLSQAGLDVDALDR